MLINHSRCNISHKSVHYGPKHETSDIVKKQICSTNIGKYYGGMFIGNLCVTF